MTPAELTDQDVSAAAKQLRTTGAAFAIATVIRTLGATAAKPGAKALLTAEGEIHQGWIGGGCVRGALAKAAKRAIAEGTPQLISLQPQEILTEKGVAAGDSVEGMQFARNGCPSKGSMDIFVEPILPLPELLIYGGSPVARALAKLSGPFQWAVRKGEAEQSLGAPRTGTRRMVVVATQGQGDIACLKSALQSGAEFIAFVGSRRKFAALSEKLLAEGVAAETLAQVHAPAGLAIDAVTPDEIALSILAQLTQVRRRLQRGENAAG